MSAPPKLPLMYRFGVFQLDVRAGELHKNGVKLKLQDQPFKVLCLLLERPGDLVSREEIRKRLWPADTFVDFDHGLNAAIKRFAMRLANPRTVRCSLRHWQGADTGLRFQSRERRTQQEPAPLHLRKAARSRARRWALFGVSVMALGAALVWAVRMSLKRPSPSSKPTITERKLTANSSENPVDGAAISPDGFYLAYSDATGLY